MLKRLVLVGLAVPSLLVAQVRQGRHVVVSEGEVEMGGQMGMTRATVQKLQIALRDAGCDPGAIDGVVGPQTRSAIACVRRAAAPTGEAAASAPAGTTVFRKAVLGPPGKPVTAVGTGLPAAAFPPPPPPRPGVPLVNSTADSTTNGRPLGTPPAPSRPDTTRRPR